MVWRLPSRTVISDGDAPRDLAALVVPLAGSVQDTGDMFVPYRLADVAGAAVEPVSAFLAELQASGRAEATLKSYCKALLRWFRFLLCTCQVGAAPCRRHPSWWGELVCDSVKRSES